MEGKYIRISIPTRFSFIAAVKSLEMNRASLLQSLSREGFKPEFSGYEFKRPETPSSRISDGITSPVKANPKSEYTLSEKNGKRIYTDPVLGEVEVRVSPGTKRISLKIDRGSYVILSLPSLSKLEDGVKFLESKRPWIEKSRNRISSKTVLVPKEILSDRHLFFDTLFENRTPLLERADYLAEMLGTKPSSVEVDFYKSKWGKCDIGGAIMLNFATNLLPAYLRDSVIIHEMTHLTYMNHGDGFHDLMEQYLQKYFALEIKRLSEEFPDRKAPGEIESEERVKDWEHYRLLSDLYYRSKKSRAIRPLQKTINDDLKKFSIV
jgi:predicted metal-dependent hydrolase